MQRTFVLFAFLLLAWLLWSGIYSTLLIGLGILSCTTVVLLMRHLQFLDAESMPTELFRKIPFYWFWLIKEIIKSNVGVIRIVLDPKLPISPTVITIPCVGKSQALMVTYANSITLTPGSVALDIKDGMVTVHCLTKESASDLEAGRLAEQIKVLESR